MFLPTTPSIPSMLLCLLRYSFDANIVHLVSKWSARTSRLWSLPSFQTWLKWLIPLFVVIFSMKFTLDLVFVVSNSIVKFSAFIMLVFIFHHISCKFPLVMLLPIFMSLSVNSNCLELCACLNTDMTFFILLNVTKQLWSPFFWFFQVTTYTNLSYLTNLSQWF